jgi:hypothetical protein
MTPTEKALELLNKFSVHTKAFNDNSGWIIDINSTKQCALIAVDEVILANPHSNPLNTDVYSTMDYWQEVKQEIEKL